MRRTICVAVTLATLSALPLAAQNAPRRTARVADPAELSGPPKQLVVLPPTKRAFFQSSAIEQLNSKDPHVLSSVVREITSFIQQDPTDSDLYLLKPTVSCQIADSSKEAMLNDVTTSIKLWKRNESMYDSLKDHYVLKAKIEFLSARYTDAMNDIDAAIRIDYSSAEQIFNNGNVKPDEPTAMRCMWSRADVNTLARLFPTDYRPALYLGLYLLQFTHYSLDADYQPILKAFERAAELNPSSALPFYFSANPYVVGGIGGLISTASATCIEDVVPRTKACVALDDIRRAGVRFLTKAIAADPAFAPAYQFRGLAHYLLRENRQAIRDYGKALELDSKAKVYGDRGLAKFDLKDYQGAIVDYTKAISQGCDSSSCPTYENRANAFLGVRDYPHAISDISQTIKNFLSGTIFMFNIDQFRRIYPEYDDMADDALCEKVRLLFNPQMSYAAYAKQFLVDAKEVDDFVLPELFLKRGDAYADMGNVTQANREYDRVSAGYPKVAEYAFTTRNGRRIRIRQ